MLILPQQTFTCPGTAHALYMLNTATLLPECRPNRIYLYIVKSRELLF